MNCVAKKQKPYGQKCKNKATHVLILCYAGRERNRALCGVHKKVELKRAMRSNITTLCRELKEGE